MCGIAGFAGGREPRRAETAVRAMLGALRHRGPDSEGIFHSEQLTLGHRRLFVFDPTPAGAQPMVSSNRCSVLVFNGAIYNFRDLRKELEQLGYAFRSCCDTEVLLHGFTEWGIDDLLNRLRGMFAIALWDGHAEKLYLVRDRLGVKPLYYTIHGNAIAFASSIRALRVAGLVGDLNPRAVIDFLQFGHTTEANAIYDNVFKLPAGHVVQWSRGSLVQKRYWVPPVVTQSPKLSFEAVVRHTEHLLLDAVRVRLAADVPVASLLSGGVDSSLICWAATKIGSHVDAYTLGTPGDLTDESTSAAATARSLGIRHHIVDMFPDSINGIENLTAAYGEPFACDSALGLLCLSRAIKPRATVLLTGDGGDDVFLGYAEHKVLWLAHRLSYVLPYPASRVWYTFRRLAAPVPQLRRPVHFLDYATGGVAAVLAANDSWVKYQRSGVLGERLVSSQPAWREMQWSPDAGRRLLTDRLAYNRDRFVSEYMTKLDGATMYHGIEARSPFLDYHLWEFAAKLPYNTRLRRGIAKAVLRELARRHLGQRVSRGRKRGFAIPVQRWLVQSWRASVDEAFRDSLLDRNGWICSVAVLKQLEVGVSRQWASRQLWYMYALERWLRYEKDNDRAVCIGGAA